MSDERRTQKAPRTCKCHRPGRVTRVAEASPEEAFIARARVPPEYRVRNTEYGVRSTEVQRLLPWCEERKGVGCRRGATSGRRDCKLIVYRPTHVPGTGSGTTLRRYNVTAFLTIRHKWEETLYIYYIKKEKQPTMTTGLQRSGGVKHWWPLNHIRM